MAFPSILPSAVAKRTDGLTDPWAGRSREKGGEMWESVCTPASHGRFSLLQHNSGNTDDGRGKRLEARNGQKELFQTHPILGLDSGWFEGIARRSRPKGPALLEAVVENEISPISANTILRGKHTDNLEVNINCSFGREGRESNTTLALSHKMKINLIQSRCPVGPLTRRDRKNPGPGRHRSSGPNPFQTTDRRC